MKYKIVYDRPGRLRLRAGSGIFTKEQGYYLSEILLKKAGAQRVETSYINGGILIYYPEDRRSEILTFIEQTDAASLLEGKPQQEDTLREVRDHFQWELAKILGRKYIISRFLPFPVRAGLITFRACRYFLKGLQSLGKGRLDVAVLDATSVTTAIVRQSFTTASSIMMLLNITELLEDYTRKKTKLALSQSLALNVDKVWALRQGEEVSIPISRVEVGDEIQVRSGLVIPLDGTVVGGEALVNESTMTGEPHAVRRAAGSSVYAGTVVEEGMLTVKVRTLANDTRLQKIAEMIDTSESLKAGVQSRAEELADSIVPYSFLTSLLTLAVTRNVTKAVSVLMVDYSCAMKLSIPISVISAMREAANRGIMVKGGKYLEAFAKADTIVFDKTGTLTDACPKVARIIPFGEYEEREVLKIAACLEEHFPHSMAKAIVRHAEKEQVFHKEEHAEVEYVVAHGISSMLYGRRVLIGSAHFIFEDEKVMLSSEEEEILEREVEGYSAVYLAVGERLAGMLCIEDPVRQEAKEVIAGLKNLGIRHVIMLTGDGEAVARSVKERLGITRYRAQVLPEDKASVIEEIKKEGHTVIMVGDGVNDSPALAAADVSVAMKEGSDIAKEVADVTLLSASLRELVTLRVLSQSLMKRISRNYHFILGFNTMLILGGILGILTPYASALLHNLSTMGISGVSMLPCLEEKRDEKKIDR